jgi:hypothetical protein
LAAHDELQRQVVSEVPDLKSLEKVLTPSYARTVYDYFVQRRKDGIRYEKGSLDRRSAVTLDVGGGQIVAIICYENNGAQFQSQGTPDKSDDILVQADLERISFSVVMVKSDAGWRQESSETGKDPRCAGFFSS